MKTVDGLGTITHKSGMRIIDHPSLGRFTDDDEIRHRHAPPVPKEERNDVLFKLDKQEREIIELRETLSEIASLARY